MTRAAAGVMQAAAMALLAGALLLPFVGGYPLAYALILLSLLLIGGWLAAKPRRAELADAGGWAGLGTFVLITLALAVTAREFGDVLYASNFLMFALYGPLRAALQRQAAPGHLLLVARLALGGAALGLLVAGMQVFGLGAVRASGFGSDPIWAAQAALILGFLALVGLGQERPDRRWLYLAGPLLGLLTVLLTGSRGPLLAAAPLLLVAVLMGSGHRRALVLLASVVLLAGTTLVLVLPGGMARTRSAVAAVAETLAAGAAAESSVGVRILIYRGSFAAFLDSPLVGHGWEQRLPVSYARVPGGQAAIEARDPTMRGNHHLHADLLDLGVGAGLLGLLGYALALAAPLLSARAAPRDSQAPGRLMGAALLATGYFGCGLSYIMFGYEFPTTQFVCLAAILNGYCRDSPPDRATG